MSAVELLKLPAIRTALKQAGVTFINGNEPGVKLQRARVKSPTKPAPPITPEQLREARAALGWSPYLLAHISRVTVSFIHELEKTGRVALLRWKPQDFDALAMIRAALERADVDFFEENGGGAAFRLRKTSGDGALS